MSIPVLDIFRDEARCKDLIWIVSDLRSAYGFASDPIGARKYLLEDLIAILDDDISDDGVPERIALAYGSAATPLELRGPLGVYLLLAQEWSSSDALIDEIRGDKEVIEALFDAFEMRRQRPNLLATLPSDGAEALCEIHAYYGFDASPNHAHHLLLRDVDLLLREEFLDPNIERNVSAAYMASESDDRPRGPLGLFIALATITTLALSSQPEPSEEAMRHLIGDLEVRGALFDLYELDRSEVSFDDVDLYRIGTTSFILRSTWVPSVSERVAVKCLLPRYFGNRRIRERTRNYKRTRITSAHVPTVKDSTDRVITMAFVDGETLAEKIAERTVPRSSHRVQNDRSSKEIARLRALTPRDVEDIRARFIAICDVLEELYEGGNCHLDLTPANIIVTSEVRAGHGDGGIADTKVSLIDFGRNFIVTERVGEQMVSPQVAIYVAPELQRNPEAGDWRSDAYSLGVILLEMAANRPLDSASLKVELDRLWIGDEYKVWSGAPALARVVEELVDERPECRLLLATERDVPGWNPFRYLGDLIRQEASVQRLYEERTSGHGFGRLHGLGLLKVRNNVQINNLVEAQSAVTKAVDDTYRDYPELGRWAVGSLLCWSLVLASFAGLTGADLGIPIASSFGQWFVSVAHSHFTVGDFWGNIAGRSVAIIFSAINVTYYVNIFSTLSLRRLLFPGSRRQERVEIALGELFMRSTAVVITIPVLWAILWNPEAWPLCCGFGTLPVVANNYFTFRMAKRANEVARREFFTHSVVWERFVTDSYSEWWKIMGLYSLAFIVIGVLLDKGVATDAGIFAVLVSITNVVKIYRLNCERMAPQVRGWLSRSILTLRRQEGAALSPP